MSDLDQLREIGRVVRQPAFRRTRQHASPPNPADLDHVRIRACLGRCGDLRRLAATDQITRTDGPPTLSDPSEAPFVAPRHLVEHENAPPLEPGTYQISTAHRPPCWGP